MILFECKLNDGALKFALYKYEGHEILSSISASLPVVTLISLYSIEWRDQGHFNPQWSQAGLLRTP